MLVIALALMVITQPLSAIAQREGAELAPTPLHSQNFVGHLFFYYHPGDLKGAPYQTMEKCSQARHQGGDVGICVMKSYRGPADQVVPPSTEIFRSAK